MMSKTGHLQLLTLFCALASYPVFAQFRCPPILPGCACHPQNYTININYTKLSCIFKNLDKETTFEIDMKIYSNDSVEIECFSEYIDWEYFINKFILNGIASTNSITFVDCPPLSDVQFNFVRERLNLESDIKQLTYNNLWEDLKPSHLSFFTNLERLHINSKHVYAVDVNLIWELTSLREFSFQAPIIELPVTFFNRSGKLESINLSFGFIQLKLEEGVFNGLISIHQININNNSIKELGGNVFGNLSTLRILNLCNNELNELPHDLFNHLTGLQELDLSSNNMTTLSGDIFRYNIYLKTLKMSDNLLTELPTRLLENSVNLEVLELANNKLTNIPNYLFSNTRKLKILKLEGNEIKIVRESLITPNLVNLELKYNHLTHLAPAFLAKINDSSSLRYLTLSKNPWRCDWDNESFYRFVQNHASKFPDLFNVTCANHTKPLFNFTQ